MALAAVINQEAFDSLNESIKSEYKKQDDGKFILDVTPVNDFALENVSGLKSALSAERAKVGDLQGKLTAFEGIDAGKAKDALKKVEDMVNWKSDDKVKEQIELIKKQLSEKHAGELGAKDETLKKHVAQLEKVLVEAEAVKALAEAKGNTALLLPHVKAATRMKQTDKGEYLVEVVDENGNARLSPAAGSTANMSIKELVAQMKTSETFAAAFEGSGASGSGAKGSGSPSGTNTISANDQAAIESNIEKIASGEITIV